MFGNAPPNDYVESLPHVQSTRSAFAFVAGGLRRAGGFIGGKSADELSCRTKIRATSSLPSNCRNPPRCNERLRAANRVEDILKKTPGVPRHSSVVGYSMLSGVENTYSSFFWVTFKPGTSARPRTSSTRIMLTSQSRARQNPRGARCFPPPAIPGVGTSGGVTFVLEDRAGQGVEFLASQPAEIHGGGAQSGRKSPRYSPPCSRPCPRCRWTWIATRCSRRA